jgi:hypothetical protein
MMMFGLQSARLNLKGHLQHTMHDGEAARGGVVDDRHVAYCSHMAGPPLAVVLALDIRLLLELQRSH